MLLVNVGLFCMRFRHLPFSVCDDTKASNGINKDGANVTLFILLRVDDTVWASSEDSYSYEVTTWCWAQRSWFDTGASMKRSESLCHLEKRQRDTSLPIWFHHFILIPVLSTLRCFLNNWPRGRLMGKHWRPRRNGMRLNLFGNVAALQKQTKESLCRSPTGLPGTDERPLTGAAAPQSEPETQSRVQSESSSSESPRFYLIESWIALAPKWILPIQSIIFPE